MDDYPFQSEIWPDEVKKNYKSAVTTFIDNDSFWIAPLIYLISLSYFYFHSRAIVPDEANFLGIAQQFSFFNSDNAPLGYGSFFWLLLNLGQSPWIIRFLFLLMMASILLISLKSIQLKKQRYILFLLFMGLPFSFWSGKIIGPEILMVLFLSLGLYYREINIQKASILIGMAIGVKLSAIFVLFYFFPFKTLKKTTLSFMFIGIGVFLTNPFNFFSYCRQISNLVPFERIQSIFNFSANSSGIEIDGLKRVLFQNSTTWDLIPDGSLSTNIMNPCLIAILLCLGTFYIPMKTLRLIFLLIALTYFMSTTSGSYGWYWFTLVPVLLDYAASILNAEKQKSFWRLNLSNTKVLILLLIVVINFYVNIPKILYVVSEKSVQIQNVENFNEECVLRKVNALEPEVIYFKDDFGIDQSFLEVLGKPMHWQFDSPELGGRRGVIVLGSRLARNEFYLSNFFSPKTKLSIEGQCGATMVILATEN